MNPELEAKILNRLQEMKRGQTTEQLAEHCQTPVTFVRVELEEQRKGGSVEMDKNGVWHLVRAV